MHCIPTAKLNSANIGNILSQTRRAPTASIDLQCTPSFSNLFKWQKIVDSDNYFVRILIKSVGKFKIEGTLQKFIIFFHLIVSILQSTSKQCQKFY
jgi:hypothetical protein